LRNRLAALAVALIAVLGVAAPAAAVQTSTAKVVIIVGATHGATAGYRSNADAAYAEAIKYTAKVTKVYSPNATWSKVKAAVKGANIVIYFGHGNGWPSPYTYDPQYTTKDGFGLNADLNGDGKLSDYENKYYGEPYMAQLELAPNAIVMLHNLCYASGNNESGVTPEPTVSVARQRIDNYAAGFIKGGARAVLADGHMGPASYLKSMFTTGQSVVDMWRSAPNYHGHESSFASTRSPGFTAYSDPDGTASGYYRSLVVKPGLTTTAITNAVGDTGLDPASLVVPGRASVLAPEAPLFGSASLADAAPVLDLPEGTRLKTVAIATPAATGSPAVIQVQGLDDPSITGYVTADRLAPRDSKAPVLLGIDSGLGRLSPNDDGRSDEIALSGIFSETVDWTVEIKNGSGAVVDTTAGNGKTFATTWDGRVDGIAVPDGTYTWTARGGDAWLNGVATGSGSLVVDTAAPAVTSISPNGSTVGLFTPNGDGVTDTIATSVTVPEAGTIAAWVTNSAGSTVRSWSVTSVAGANSVTWDGRNDAGSLVADGDYALHVAARDRTGNQGAALDRPLRSIGLLSAVKSSVKVFYPQDADSYALTATLSFTVARPSTVTWTIRNSANAVVLTRLADTSVAAGTQSFAWNGRDANGTLLPRGVYTSYVTASDGVRTISSSTKVEMNAFAIAPSVTTAKRGSKVTITATTAETLTGSAKLYVTQPGYSTWVVTMTRVDGRTWRSTVTLKTGKPAGTVSFKVWGKDAAGRTQATIRSMPLT
jgi:flagellar hook assembly protein FlgD